MLSLDCSRRFQCEWFIASFAHEKVKRWMWLFENAAQLFLRCFVGCLPTFAVHSQGCCREKTAHGLHKMGEWKADDTEDRQSVKCALCIPRWNDTRLKLRQRCKFKTIGKLPRIAVLSERKNKNKDSYFLRFTSLPFLPRKAPSCIPCISPVTEITTSQQ